ncbi:MAG: type II/IV secretion system ATPase subunit [Euryarchaeota archaeon]|nr:type II/IV secretion system ATPase subunit [Euryarchaeota archaeon]
MGSSELMGQIREIINTKEVAYDLEAYDREIHGDLVDDRIPDGYTEVDRYWVDEPCELVQVLYDTAKKVPVYYVLEPTLTPFEMRLLGRLYEDLSDVLTLDDIDLGDHNAGGQVAEEFGEPATNVGNGDSGGSDSASDSAVDGSYGGGSGDSDGGSKGIGDGNGTAEIDGGGAEQFEKQEPGNGQNGEHPNGDAVKSRVLRRKALELLGYYSIDLNQRSVHKIMHFLERNYIGYGKLDTMLKDSHIEDISCDGIGVPVFIYHNVHKNIETNVTFGEEYLNSFVIQLAQRGSKHISIGSPMVNATLPDGSRLQATLGKEVTTRGSSFTIRRFKEDPFTPIDMLNFKTCSSEMLAYLWLAIENNKSMVLAGGTASGKTSALNAVSMFIPPIAKVVSIEDTRELTLHHENWIAGVTREAIIAHEGVGEISMFELLKAALRQRPEYILVGEVRGAEALTLFQAMSTGHTTYSTMHASDIETLLNRLQGEPINVPHAMLQALNIVCIQMQTYIGSERVRRTKTLLEITGLDQRTGGVRINDLYTWNPANDTFEYSGNSYVLDQIIEERGWTKNQLTDALSERKEILEYMAERNINNYKEISQLVQQYALDPDAVLTAIRG